MKKLANVQPFYNNSVAYVEANIKLRFDIVV